MNWFLLIVFGILPFIGALFAFKTWHPLRYGTRVPGTITGCERVRAGEHNKTFHMPIVEFRDEEGKTHKLTMKLSETPDRSGEPEYVNVIYPKGKPRAARLERFASLWLIPLFLCSPALLIGAILGGRLLWWRIFE